MAHNLFSARFYNNRTAPAWHGIGINSTEPMTASEAFARVGAYQVGLVPLEVILPDGLNMPTEYSAVVRQPTPDDPIHRVFGAPVSNYELITPQQAVAMWDAHVVDEDGRTVPVETFGVLGKGERLFITVQLPRIDVRGDEVAMYMVYDNPMYSGKTAGVYTTGVRTVCQNTLTLGIASAVQRRIVAHTPGSRAEIARWLGEIYGAALMTAQVAQEAYTLLASKPASLPQVQWIAETVYAMPGEPREGSRARNDESARWAQYEYRCRQVSRMREAVVELFSGAGVGMETLACDGTLFGAYNAVAEFETYRRSRGSDFAVDLVSGDRAGRIRAAFNTALELAR